MAMSREQGRREHTASTGHEQFSETIYGVVCAACHNYILIDHTNDPADLPRARDLPPSLLIILTAARPVPYFCVSRDRASVLCLRPYPK